jgi:hypothetical protein
LLNIKKEYNPEKVVILSINVINLKGQTAAEVKRYNMDYTVLVGRGHQLTSLYKIVKLPHLFILDQDVIIQSSGRFLKTEEMKVVIDRLLNEKENEKQQAGIK